MRRHRRRSNPGLGLSTGAIVGLAAGGGLLAYFLYKKLSGPSEPPKELGAEETAEQPAEEQPAAEQPAAEQPAAEQPASDKPAEQPAAEQPAAQPPAQKPALPRLRIGTLTSTKKKGVLKITSNVEGGMLIVNDKPVFDTSIPIIPRTFDYPVDGTLDGPVRVKLQLRWGMEPSARYSVPMTLTVRANDVRTIRLNPKGYVQRSYYAGIAERSKDTATIARNRLMDEAITAQKNKYWVLAVQKYQAVINSYPGTAEARAAAVAVAIIKNSAAYKREIAAKG